LADEFGLKIPSVNDPCSYDPCRIASPTTETYINDMIRSVLIFGDGICEFSTLTDLKKQAEGW
jgi:hypothetical protein